MKFLDAKRARGSIENKMGPGPSSDKTDAPASEGSESGSENPPPANPVDRPTATPAAARLAEELGVDLSQLKGSGVDGLIVVSDVRSAADRKAGEPRIGE